MGKIGKTAVVVGLMLLLGHLAHAQAIAEAAGTTSSSAGVHTVKPPTFNMAVPASQSSSPHLLLRTGPPPDEVNRKDFEDNAGDKAGKMLLRSVPAGAEIFINDRFVGRTPLLMVIAPGKYMIEMRGARQESGRQTVGVMPKETQNVVINLHEQYPSSITLH